MAKDVRIWKPEGLEGMECLRAEWGDVRFERHFHDGYAVGVIEAGALGFKYLGRDEVAPAGSVNMVVPGEVHDGHAASSGGWRYRMFYLDSDVVERAVRDMGARGTEPLPSRAASSRIPCWRGRSGPSTTPSTSGRPPFWNGRSAWPESSRAG